MPGSADGVAGSCGAFTMDGAGRDGMDSLIGTTLFFFIGATARSASVIVFLRSPVVADLMSFFGDTRSSFVPLSARGFRGRIAVASVTCAVFEAPFELRRLFRSPTASGFSDPGLLLDSFSLSGNGLGIWFSSFSSPNFLLEPALRSGRDEASVGFAGFVSSVATFSAAGTGLFFGSSFGCAGISGRGSASPLILGLGSSAPLDLVGLSILTGSSSTNRDVGGGPRSGDSFASAASVHTARSSAWLRPKLANHEQPARWSELVTHLMVLRGYILFSWIGGSRPSCIAASSSALLESLGLRVAAGLRPPLFLGLTVRLPPGDVTAFRFAAGSTPSPCSMALQSMSCASILALISRAWSAILWDDLLSSSSLSSSSMRPLRVRFSDSSRPHSPSRERMRRDWAELTLAMSRFWRRNFLRTRLTAEVRSDHNVKSCMHMSWVVAGYPRVSMVSVDTGGSFSLAILT